MNYPYQMTQDQKEFFLLNELNKLSHHHYINCPEYARILDLFYGGIKEYKSLADIPYLPVNLFKTHDLLSIKREQIFKTLTSSGTTSGQTSKIFLDAETAQRQTKALAEIMASFLGKARLPMIVIDNPHVIKDRFNYGARGAAIVGMMTFGRDIFYALNDDMTLNKPGLGEWLQNHQNTPILIFGMTYIIWKHFLNEINDLDLHQGILLHTGGWKKMQEEAIDNSVFKEKLKRLTGISRCHNFYGMAEQVGNVFVECEEGFFHCPTFGDIIVRDPADWKESKKEGVIQVLSTLPASYPGHCLLTEDLGILMGIDNCSCGRKGKFFHVLGRAPQAEIRGCSDTYAIMGMKS